MAKKKLITKPAPTPEEMAANPLLESSKKLTGKCPVCSAVLEEQGEYYKCKDHYLIVKASFDRAWQTYRDSLECTNVFEDQKAAGELLMDMLLNTNVAENKPAIKHLWVRSKTDEQD